MNCLSNGRKQLVLFFTALVFALSAPFSEYASASLSLPQAGADQVELEKKAQDQQAVPAGSAAAARVRRSSKGLSLSELLRKYPETIMTRGPRSKSIALTFDDVPDPRFTPQLLDVLKQHHVRATFFVVGSRAEKHPALVARMIREGHVIGNHSYNHPQFAKLQMNEFKAQIIRTENILFSLSGYKPKLIRPPYGDINEQQLKWAKSHGYKLVNWNVDSLDWRGLPKAQVRNNIIAHTGRGSIILQHGGGGHNSNLKGTIQALPEVISILRKRGYTFVTVPQMLQVSQKK
ncbi:polysaccharide deacetylase family protein [Paenibacillus albidus]|uniref:polysaccharide deacetylase family protein n=1 Tax=Paenibacillus albidus TaxID=2041023 RepID=UPI001BEC6C18|nr:polysaccharide deacetylase family protein [Paenibacillus albidus]MBT2287888.1 polysaccharide deacetylase family protein [Paenibacillus albidus]